MRYRCPTSLARAKSVLAFVVVLCVAVAALPAPTNSQARQGVAFPDVPRVTNPLPEPGSLVPAGPTVIGATVTGAADEPITMLVDGQEVDGTREDPDGDLTPLDGIATTIAPGPHRIAVRVGRLGVLREWNVVASGLQVDTFVGDDTELQSRYDTAAVGPSIVINTDHPEVAAAVPLLARHLDATIVPIAGRLLSLDGWARLRASGRDVLLIGDADIIDARIDAQIASVDLSATRVGGSSAAEIAAAVTRMVGADGPPGAASVVVAPAQPLSTALAAAGTAADLGIGLLLVNHLSMTPLTRNLIDQFDTVLLSADLSRFQRAMVTRALGPQGVASDRVMQPEPAQVGLVVADSTNRSTAVLAGTVAAPDRPVLFGTDRAREWVASASPERVTVISPASVDDGRVQVPADGTDDAASTQSEPHLPALATAVALDADAPAVVVPGPLIEPADSGRIGRTEDVVDQLRRAAVDGTDAPQIGALIDATGAQAAIEISSPAAVQEATVHVSVLSYEWPGTTSVEDGVATWRAGEPPALPLSLQRPVRDAPTPVQITTEVTAAGRITHQSFNAILGLDPTDTVSPEGWIVAGGADDQVGDGRLYTYSVEIEPESRLDIAAVEEEVSRILTDARSWTADGAVAFRRVGRSEESRLRVVVARPSTVDDFCGRVGLSTGGRVSCWDGYRAMLNLDRWNIGVPPFHADLEIYRQYLVNHEVGHGLGHGHEFCRNPGGLAPVMMQQTGGIGACLVNGWPFP